MSYYEKIYDLTHFTIDEVFVIFVIGVTIGLFFGYLLFNNSERGKKWKHLMGTLIVSFGHV